MKLSEVHHANILTAFYNGLTEALGEAQGRAAFLMAERAYGERRGRRMALRALRDGNPPDFTSYFAYGELLTTPGGYDGSYEASEGLIHETQWKCPWASAFKDCGSMDCAKLYCREIDAAVVRGFNPLLDYRYGGNMHENGTCVFYFRSPEINEKTLETCSERLKGRAPEKKDMTWHSGDVYQMFCRIVSQICPETLGKIKEDIKQRLGSEAFELLEELKNNDYDSIQR
ncbi:MAG: L-2-amino-thiazoline-4-carboxylic acid hydrolase [Firmicutes bacterium]|nr:L-2-amino-thiazoline-4-carboxylic acid hydrolase [Bacillota bacterium]